MSDKDVNPAFVSSGRNDWLAAGNLSRVRQDRTTTVTYNVVPSSPDLRFVEFCDVVSLHDGGSTVDVEFEPKATARMVYHGGWQHRFPRFTEKFAQVVLALGQETGFEAPCNHAPGCSHKRETNSWATRLVGLIPQNPKQHLIVKDEMEVGLQSGDGSLRVLGASFLAHPYADAVFNDSYFQAVPLRGLADRAGAGQSRRIHGRHDHRASQLLFRLPAQPQPQPQQRHAASTPGHSSLPGPFADLVHGIELAASTP